jgi:hypothetical protein
LVLGVLSATAAQIALVLWCAADLLRDLQLWANAYEGYAIWIFLSALLAVMVLVVACASKLRGK